MNYVHQMDYSGFPNFANKTFANGTFANGQSLKMHWRKYSGLSPMGESPMNVLAKVQWTLANGRKSNECIGESIVDSRQWAKVQ
jgi:hypothetical protein